MDEKRKMTLQMFELVIQHMNMLAYSLDAPFFAELVEKDKVNRLRWDFNEEVPNQSADKTVS